MKKNIPEIDELLDGINDPDIMLHAKASDKEKQEEVNDTQEEKTPDPPSQSINEESTNEEATITAHRDCKRQMLGRFPYPSRGIRHAK